MKGKRRSIGKSNLIVILTKTFCDKNFYKGCFAWEVIKGYLLHLLGTLMVGLLPGGMILWFVSLRSDFSINWNTVWTLIPYFIIGGVIIGMITAKKALETRLSIFIFLVVIFVLVPIDIFLNGIKTVLQFAGYGFVFGLLASSIQFMVLTVHYNDRRVTNITDNFNKDNFVTSFFISVFTSIIGVVGHSIINLLRIFSK
jgi:hypothetical protein